MPQDLRTSYSLPPEGRLASAARTNDPPDATHRFCLVLEFRQLPAIRNLDDDFDQSLPGLWRFRFEMPDVAAILRDRLRQSCQNPWLIFGLDNQ